MRQAVIIDAVRTAGGKRNGKLKDWHPVDLASEVLGGLAERNSLDTEIVDDVIMGCAMPQGTQFPNIGRLAALTAGLDTSAQPASSARNTSSNPSTSLNQAMARSRSVTDDASVISPA